jgi:hypothetical protein
MAITTQAPKYSPELLTATEQALRNHDLRIKAGLDCGTVLDTLTANGVTADAAYGQLTLTQNGAPAHSAVLLESLAKQRAELFYPRTTEGVTAKDQLDRAGKAKMLSEEGGLARFEMLPQTAPKSEVVVLDQSRLTQKQWLSLPIKQRVELSGLWGHKIVGQIMAR